MTPAAITPDRQRFRQVLAEIADKAKAKLPQCNGRVEKAVTLVLNNDIDYHPEESTALVHSCTDAAKTYHVRGKYCECPDYERAPQHLCKHVLGVMFLVRLQQVLVAETPQNIEAPHEPPGIPGDHLPEAPASCNVRVLVGGHEVQWTLRGHDEAEVFTRLQTLLARKDVRPLLPKPAPRAPGQWKRREYTGR
jgi:hypothetical protein